MKARLMGKEFDLPEGLQLKGGATRQVYRSKWEAAYAQELEAQKRAGEILDWWYEPFALKLTEGVRYRPDFLVYRAESMVLELRGRCSGRH